MKARNICLLLFIMITAIAADLFGGGKTIAPADIERWEYEIMSTLIASYYGSDFELLLIDDHTEAWCIRERLDELRDEWPGLKAETIDSLITRNNRAVPLENKLAVATKWQFMSREQYREILKSGGFPNWDYFEQVYPETPGFMVISRVGFDSRYSQALIYFGNAYRCRDKRSIPKDRSIAFFTRRDGEWVLEGIKKGFQSFYYE
jgi:hypothetical protein